MKDNILIIKVKIEGIEYKYYLDTEEYKVHANYVAKRSGNCYPYPEIVKDLNRPKLKGIGLFEQVKNKVFYDKL